jgi:hypothetical protein
MLTQAETRVLHTLCRAHPVAACAACGKVWKPAELAEPPGDRLLCPGCARDLTEQVAQHFRACPAVAASGDGHRTPTEATVLTTGEHCPRCGSLDMALRVSEPGRSEVVLCQCGACNLGFFRYRRAGWRVNDGRPPIAGGSAAQPAWLYDRRPTHLDVDDLLDLGSEAIQAARRARARADVIRLIIPPARRVA